MNAAASTCEVCRFDAAAYTWADLMGTLRTAQRRAVTSVEGISSADLAAAGIVEPDSAEAAVALHNEVVGLKGDDRAKRLEEVVDAAHRAGHDLMLLGRAVEAAGLGTVPHQGTVVGLFASGGGVPKLPVDEVSVGYRGVIGDRQVTRRHHGRVWQALCIWSAEVIEAFAADGHPIAPGNAGENITVAGLDWASLRPGTRLQFGSPADGNAVLAEISGWTTPCSKNARWFRDGEFNLMSHELHPGTSRLYASVLIDGVIRIGDPVLVEPPHSTLPNLRHPVGR